MTDVRKSEIVCCVEAALSFFRSHSSFCSLNNIGMTSTTSEKVGFTRGIETC